MYPLRGTVNIDEYDKKNTLSIRGMGRSAILYRLNAEIGDEISIGNSDFKITAILRYRPDQSIDLYPCHPQY